MRQLVIEPRDSLLFRDAREFAAEAGNARSLAFPLPSVLAGAVRTRWGSASSGLFAPERIPELLQLSVWSPFLVGLKPTGGEVSDWYFPAPADAIMFEENHEVVPLLPCDLPEDAVTEFRELGLKPLTLAQPRRDKPLSRAPSFWNYQGALKSWLSGAGVRGWPGISGPQRESRIHVRIGAQGTAADRALFATEMLRFVGHAQQTDEGEQKNELGTASRLALVALLQNDQVTISGVHPLGGERRLARWWTQNLSFPGCPAEIRAEVKKTRQARLLLTTPGSFNTGIWRPADLGDGVVLEAAALKGHTVASGWDLGKRKPKPSRRLAPAGTVYFVNLPRDWDHKQVDAWIDERWLRPISDDPQSCRDGFGVALVGAAPQKGSVKL